VIVNRLKAFGAFWYDFVVGDDWRVALGVVVALTATWGLARHGHPGVWWLVPVAVVVLLPLSIARAARATTPVTQDDEQPPTLGSDC